MSGVVYNPFSSALQVLPSVEWARNVVRQRLTPKLIYAQGYDRESATAPIDELLPGYYYCYNVPLTTLKLEHIVPSNLRSIVTFVATDRFQCSYLSLAFEHLVPGRIYRIDLLQGYATFSSLHTNRINSK